MPITVGKPKDIGRTVHGNFLELKPGSTYAIELEQEITVQPDQLAALLTEWGSTQNIRFLVLPPGVRLLRAARWVERLRRYFGVRDRQP